ncbi:MAG: hypothetical protein KKF20_03110, partial [Bacteroidetes bacterium]|nr:hypothetical protein [Bacteroidota bacterium]
MRSLASPKNKRINYKKNCSRTFLAHSEYERKVKKKVIRIARCEEALSGPGKDCKTDVMTYLKFFGIHAFVWNVEKSDSVQSSFGFPSQG